MVSVAADLHSASTDGLDLLDIASEAASSARTSVGTAPPTRSRAVRPSRPATCSSTSPGRAPPRCCTATSTTTTCCARQARSGPGPTASAAGWPSTRTAGSATPASRSALLSDPLHTDPVELVRLLPSRLEAYAEGLEQPLDRLRAWGFVAATLSQVWSCEDGGAPEAGPGAVADALRPR